MSSRNSKDTLLMHSARTAYRTVRSGYRQLRALKNRLCNLVDVPLIILIYHRVIELPSDPEMIAVGPDNFRRQLDYLKQRYRIVRFEEDWSGIKERSIAITFDDGYADNLLEALPILEELQVPATFFVSTGNLDSGGLLWWHRLEALLLSEGDFPPRFHLQDPRFGRTWESASLQDRQGLYAELCMLLRRVGPKRQTDWLAQLEAWSGYNREEDSRHRLLTVRELKQLATSPMATIGAHTVSHAALAALPEEQQRHEIFASKQQLEGHIGKPVTAFSYPFGRKCEYNRTSIKLCREAGFNKVAANFPGQVHRWTDPLQLPRHLVRNWDQQTFAAELEGFWTR